MSQLNIKQVIEQGYCIGCGVCAHLKPEAISMRMNEYGQFQAKLKDDDVDTRAIDRFCPFSDYCENEDEIARDVFGEKKYTSALGYYESTYAGYVKEDNYRMQGSSGGFGSWFCSELLDRGIINGVIHVKSSVSEDGLFEYGFSESKEEVRADAKSKYYPVKLDQILDLIKQKEGPFLFVGIPCMVKALRLLAKGNADLRSAIPLTMGLVCGHIKSKAFSEMLAWQLGVPPDHLAGIDFRTKLEGFGSNRYGVTVYDRRRPTEGVVSKPVDQMFGTNWGLGYFKSKACDFCDDVMGETADVTIGDAWLPEYVQEMAGTNILVVRNKLIDNILEEAEADSRIYLDRISPEKVLLSQKSGINHRRKGLQYRLYLNDKANLPSPKKRLPPSSEFPRKFKKVQERRVELRDKSHRQFLEAKRKGDYSIFENGMAPLNHQYAQLYRTPLLIRAIRKLKRLMGRG